jgi:hypothetical protein
MSYSSMSADIVMTPFASLGGMAGWCPLGRG